MPVKKGTVFPHRIIDHTGQRFGRLVCVEYRRIPGRGLVWLCRCDCGKAIDVRPGNLRSGHTQSCGCLMAECAVAANTTHGAFGTRLYGIWAGMKSRCLNPRRKIFAYYGAKGVRVCDEWLCFEPFRDWALSHGYADDLTIDRIDPRGHYRADNCRWIPLSEQWKTSRRMVNLYA